MDKIRQIHFSECGGYIFTDEWKSGSIQSPGYPGNYPNYTRCIWILQAPEMHIVQLSVTFEGERFDELCSDYVEVMTSSLSTHKPIPFFGFTNKHPH